MYLEKSKKYNYSANFVFTLMGLFPIEKSMVLTVVLVINRDIILSRLCSLNVFKLLYRNLLCIAIHRLAARSYKDIMTT